MFSFDELPRRAQRAAFAHMKNSPQGGGSSPVKRTSKSLGSGDRHKQLTAAKAKIQQIDAADNRLQSLAAQLKSGAITAAEARSRLNSLRAASPSRRATGRRRK